MLPKRRSEQLSSALWWARGTDVSWANRTVDVHSGPAPPPRPDPPVVRMSGLWTRQVKYELDCSCFRRDVRDSVLDSLESKREGCFQVGSTQRRLVLPSPAPPRRPAAPPCVAPTRPARDVSGFWIRQVGFISGPRCDFFSKSGVDSEATFGSSV